MKKALIKHYGFSETDANQFMKLSKKWKEQEKKEKKELKEEGK